MSVTHSSLDQSQPEILRCTRCNTELPHLATFCGQCGERVEKGAGEIPSLKNTDITTRYRITSLLQRQPPAQLFLALDTQQQRPVVIHDVDISSLAEPERAQAIAAMQQEYDLLRRQRIPAIMPLVELRYFHGHLYIISGWPFALSTRESVGAQPAANTVAHQLSTLHDLLQSGLGLPEPELALTWIVRLSRALEQLHRQDIMLGTIDPQTILISQHNYSGEPVLVVSWLPDILHELIPEPLNNAHVSPFRAPESLMGATAPCSDIYSLGAVLYLLLTGVTPEHTQQALPTLLERDPHCNPVLSGLVMQALASDPEERFQNAGAFSEALASLLPRSRAKGTATAGSQGKSNTDIHITSTSVDNETDKVNKRSLLEVPEDVTSSVVPIQAQMARRYLSRIKTGKLGLNEPFTGEAAVEEGLNAEKKTYEHTVGEGFASSHKNEDLTSSREREATTSTMSSEQSAEKHTSQALVDERPNSVQDEETQAPMAILPADTVATTEGYENNSGSRSDEYDNINNIAQIETVLIRTEDMKLASALIGEAGNQSRQTRATNAGAPVPDSANAPLQPAKNSTRIEPRHSSRERIKGLLTGSLPRILHPKDAQPDAKIINGQTTAEGESSLIKRIQRFLLGEHQHVTTAAALIETPMRVQPHQSYTMRINVVGRPVHKTEVEGGLSALCEGNVVHIEVRSALYQNYAYIVQQADVTIPAEGYVAEVLIPMQPLGSGPSGRRERLHVFFMDEERNPLYEKPFVLELFISHLVHSGREGHNVLSIPL